jgi:MYXO-CTERM domain-containing protein
MSRPALLAIGMAAATAAWASSSAGQPAYAGYVDSVSHPGLRVHYPADMTEAAAQAVLDAADSAWDAQVTGMGYPSPATVDESDAVIPGLYVYIESGGYGSYVEPMGDNPSTPRTDCTLRAILASDSTGPGALQTTMPHVFNQTMTMSADCGEPFTASEHTSVAVTLLLYPNDPTLKQYLLPTFQDNPQHGLYCYIGSHQLFHYGGGLFDVFLEDRYGDYDGKLLATVWTAAEQDGTVTVSGGWPALSVPNHPNIVEATSTVLAPTTFADAFGEFAQWRYFVGNRDDGQHFRDGSKWTGSEVAIDTTLALASLPVVHGSPVEAPNALGTVYVELALAGLEPDRGVRFGFKGDPGAAWRVDALLLRSDATADVQPVTLDDTQSGEVTLSELGAYATATFVVSNLGAPDFDPDEPICNTGLPFFYDLSVADLALAPTIAAVSPYKLNAGTTSYVWVSGTSFADGLTAALSGDGIEVLGVDWVDPTLFGLDLAIGADATSGPRDLTVTNPDTLTGTLPGAMTVVTGMDPSGGCACTAGRAPSRHGWRSLAWLGLGAALLLRRRRGPS